MVNLPLILSIRPEKSQQDLPPEIAQMRVIEYKKCKNFGRGTWIRRVHYIYGTLES